MNTRPIKKIVVPPIIHFLYLKVFGKQLFINRYTKKVPVASKLINIIESKTILNHSREQIQQDYKKWLKKNYPTKNLLKKQSIAQKQWSNRPLISILVPTYNTDTGFLRACIESVINQSYDNWELCIADDASTNEEVRDIIDEYATKNSKIKKVFRKNNGHICEATNSALELSSGEFIALLDHDDYLWPNALYEVVRLINAKSKVDFVYTDEDKINDLGNIHADAFFKPDWSPEFLRSINYITHFAVIRRSLVEKVGGFRKGFEGAQDWDLFLRISRITDKIVHLPKVVYSWRISETSTASAPSAKDYAYVNQKKAIEDDVKSRGYKAKIEWQIPFSMWKVEYELKNNPKVSIIIPTKDSFSYIEKCLSSIYGQSSYKNYEVVVVDTGTTEKAVWDLYDEYKKVFQKGAFRVVNYEKEFNFSSACNFGAENSRGEFLIFLNNDTEVITKSWIEDMLGYAQQDEVGVVGCRLYYPGGKLQHAGIILGVGGQDGTPGIAGHYFPAYMANPPQSPLQDLHAGGTRNFAGVTAACFMVSREKYSAVKGFDPKFKIAFNDVDFCLKIHQKGWRNVYLPHVELYHYESISIGKPGAKQRDLDVFANEIEMMLKKWRSIIENDPYYNPNLRRDIANAQPDPNVGMVGE